MLALYNATEYPLSHNFTGLDYGQHMFTAHVLDKAGNVNSTEIRTVTVPAPQAPIVTDEFPYDNMLSVGLNPMLSINVSDLQGDNLEIKFMTNASESWSLIGTMQSGGNDTYTQSTTVFDEYNTDYWWSVNVSDSGGHWTNETYVFTTEMVPIVNLVSPVNNSVIHDDQVLFTANVVDDTGIKNVSLYTNISGSCQLEQTMSTIGEYNYDPSMSLWMHFNNESGVGEDYSNNDMVYDYSDDHNHGTKTGSVYTTNGRFDGAFRFDGVDDKITIPSDGSLDFGQQGTISFWLNWSGSAVDHDGVISCDGGRTDRL
jgi:hypothetical protein